MAQDLSAHLILLYAACILFLNFYFKVIVVKNILAIGLTCGGECLSTTTYMCRLEDSLQRWVSFYHVVLRMDLRHRCKYS